MIFTKEQIKIISRGLDIINEKDKDSEFPIANSTFNSSEQFVGLQNGKNVRIPLSVLKGEFAPVTGILLLTPSPITLDANRKQTLQIRYNIAPPNAGNTGVRFISADSTIASVSNTGLITAVSGGTTTITISSVENPTIKATITVIVTQSVDIPIINLSVNEWHTTTPFILTTNWWTPTITYTPSNTTQTGVTWRVEGDTEAVEVDNSLGYTRFRATRDSIGMGTNHIRFVATSIYNSNIYDSYWTRALTEYISVNPTTLNFPSLSTIKTVRISSSSEWEVLNSDSWIHVGYNDFTVATNSTNKVSSGAEIWCDNNSGSTRTGTIVFALKSNSSITATLTVTQEGASFVSINPNSVTISSNQQTVQIQVTSSGIWTASSYSNWITVDTPQGNNNSVVRMTVLANTTPSIRTGTVTITLNSDPTKQSVFTIVQNATGYIRISPETLQVSATPIRSSSITVNASDVWNFIGSFPSWITLQQQGIDYFNISVSNNTTTTERTALIPLQLTNDPSVTATLTVVQESGSSGRIQIFPSTLTFEASDNRSISTSLSSTGAWTALVSDNWISISSTSGSTSRELQISVQNNAGSYRTGTVTFRLTSDSTITAVLTINQKEIEDYINISPTNLRLSRTASNSNISISASGAWTTSINQDWITIDNPTGSGSISTRVSVTTNSDPTFRNGNIVFSLVSDPTKQTTLTITQSGSSLTISPEQVTFASGVVQSANIAVTATDQWYFATEFPDWLILQQQSQTSFNITASPNTGPERSVDILLRFTSDASVNATLHVIQNGARIQTLAVSPTIIDFTAFPQGRSVTVTASSNWTASTNYAWINLSAVSGTSGIIPVGIYCDQNTDINRSGIVTFTLTSDITKTVNVTVNQEGTGFVGIIVEPDTVSFSADGIIQSQNVSVTSSSEWEISQNIPWVTIQNYTQGNINLLAQPNTGDDRIGTIVLRLISDNTKTASITVTQSAPTVHSLVASPDTLNFAAGGISVSQSVSVTATDTWSFSTTPPGWITIGSQTQSGFNVTALVNNGQARTAILNLRLDNNPDITATVTINQSSGSILSASPNVVYFNANPVTPQNISVISSSLWNFITAPPSWISIGQQSQTGFNIIASSNTGVARNATLTLRLTNNQNATANVIINQDAAITKTNSIQFYVVTEGTSNPITDVEISVLCMLQKAGGGIVATNQKVAMGSNGRFIIPITYLIADNPQSWQLQISAVGYNTGTFIGNYNFSQLPDGGTLTLSDKGISPTTSSLYVYPSEIMVNPQSHQVSAQLTSTGAWTAVSNSSFITLVNANGVGSSIVRANISENTTELGRFGTITYTLTSNPSQTATLYISQEPKNILTVSPSNLTFAATAMQSQNVSVYATGTWSFVQTIPNWVVIQQQSQEGFNLTLSNNTGTTQRVYDLVLQLDDDPTTTATIHITQSSQHYQA